MPNQQPFVGKGDEEWAKDLLPHIDTLRAIRRRVAEALAAQREHCAKVAGHYALNPVLSDGTEMDVCTADRIEADIRAQSGRP